MELPFIVIVKEISQILMIVMQVSMVRLELKKETLCLEQDQKVKSLWLIKQIHQMNLIKKKNDQGFLELEIKKNKRWWDLKIK